MLDIDTFLTQLYTIVDDFCIENLPQEQNSFGPAPSLCRSEVITLAVFGQLSRFCSERDYWRFARQRLRHLFPKLPDRSQFSRLQCRHQVATFSFGLRIAEYLSTAQTLGAPIYEAIDRCGITTRWKSRRGFGWLPDCTDKGLCSRLGWFHGLHLLTCVTQTGVISGFGLASASAKDQPMAEDFFRSRWQMSGWKSVDCASVDVIAEAALSAARNAAASARQEGQSPGLYTVGRNFSDGDYIADKGFGGRDRHARWLELYQARLTCPPQRQKVDGDKHRWPQQWHTLIASCRQIVETVHDKLLNFCRLSKERPHELSAFCGRLSAKIALHNFCVLLNFQAGTEPLAFADLIGW